MRLDSLARAIERADYMTFREIALIALSRRGFVDAQVSDGWRDGGRDIRIFSLPPNPARFAVQTTVERNWRQKLRQDAAKVSAELGITDMLFVSATRVPDAEFQDVQDEIWKKSGVRVQKMDSQGIASRAIADGYASTLLGPLGLPAPTERGRGDARSALRESVAYAYSFFGTETEEFRRTIVEQAIIAACEPERLPRGELEQRAAEILSLEDGQRVQVRSAIDRMLQDGRLLAKDGHCMLSEVTADSYRAIVALRENDWAILRHDVEECLIARSLSNGIDSSIVDAVMGTLGALILSTGDFAAKVLDHRNPHTLINRQLKNRLRELHALLDTCAIGEGAARDEATETLAEIAMSSSIGQHLMAGEVFVALASMETPQLIRALGAGAELTVILDSSVSIPILAGLLYHPTSSRHGVAAAHVYDQLRRHEIKTIIPRDYLEETASHLLDAFINYRAIVLQDEDLAYSTNAFVAHFATLHREGTLKDKDFERYLSAFGFDSRLARGNYFHARDIFMDRIAALYERYEIMPAKLSQPSDVAIRRAEEAFAFAEFEGKFHRAKVLQQHDVKTIAYLYSQESDGANTNVLCTWDNLHFHVREADKTAAPRWQVVDPAFLGDVLSLARANDSEMPLLSPVVAARAMTEAAAKAGSRVWDVLAELESGELFDADILRLAKAFKEDYVASHVDRLAFNDIRSAWERWKQTRPAK